MAIETVGIFLKPGRPEAAEVVRSVVKCLSENAVEALCDPDAASLVDGVALPREEIVQRADLAVVLGGDGTLLSVARAVGTRSVPILGVNLGTLGFLTEVSAEEVIGTLQQALSGAISAEARFRLEAVVTRGGVERGRFLALNDAVIAQTALSRMINLATTANGDPVTTFHADGLIVSTPTGSTAYSLSAGGPLLLPGSGVVVLTPICPHALTQRPFVFPQSVVLEVEVDTRGGQVSLTVDGQDGMDLVDGDCVRLGPSEHPAWMIASPTRNHFEILREKLRWGER